MVKQYKSKEQSKIEIDSDIMENLMSYKSKGPPNIKCKSSKTLSMIANK